MREVLEDHKTLILLNHNFLQCHHMLMAQMLEESNFPHGRDGKPVPLAFHPNLFQGHLVLSVNVYRFEYFPICACANDRLVSRLAIIYGIGGFHLWRERGPWFDDFLRS